MKVNLQMSHVRLPDRCANLACPNEVDQGGFTLIQSTDFVAVGGHRPVQLWMCQPCAAVLMNGSTTTTTSPST